MTSLHIDTSEHRTAIMAISATIKWGKEVLQVEVDPSDSLNSLKSKIQERTRVPAEKQKLLGLKPGSADNSLSSLGFVPTKHLLLIGAPEGTVIPTAVSSVENAGSKKSGNQQQTSLELNGITNIGNTCYLSSALQLIRSIPEVKDFLQGYQGDSQLLKEIGALLHRLSEKTSESTAPITLLREFQAKFPQFAAVDESYRPMQQDAHEALNSLLQEISPALPSSLQYLFSGELHQILNTSLSSPASDDTAEHATSVPQVDESTTSTTTSSTTETKENVAPFTILSCNLSGEVQGIEAALDKVFNEEFSTDSEPSQQEKKYSRVSRIAKAPEYLLIHLVRFSWRTDVNKKAKILKPISFPVTLDIDRFVTPELRDSQKPIRQAIRARQDAEMERRKRSRLHSTTEEAPSTDASEVDPVPATLQNESGYYELCGVISHKGRSADGGHYIYWGKRGGRWIVYDDTHAAEVSEEDVLRLRGIGESHIAYVLLYRSRDPLTKKGVASY